MVSDERDPRVVALSGPRKGVVIILPEGESTVGRDASNLVCLPDPMVSRSHCRFRRVGDDVFLADRGSHNGTKVNGEAVKAERKLKQGDQISVGASLLRFAAPGEESLVETVNTPPLSGLTLRPQDSAYLSSQDFPSSSQSSISPVRVAHDTRLLLRLSTMLHSFRALQGADTVAVQQALSAHLLSLLANLIPAQTGRILSPVEAETSPETANALTSGVALLTETKEGKNAVMAPVIVRDQVEQVLWFESKAGSPFDEGHLQLLTAVAGMAAVAWENASILDWLQSENEQLRGDLTREHGMVGGSTKIAELQRQIARVASTQSTVLILGESGTGKELIARAVHKSSNRATGPFVAINCAALTETLLESELFGHEKGSFTGAAGQHKGKLEVAEGGTVFLDEIGEMPLSLQAKLLRVLQERELQRVGGTRNIPLNIRLLAATHRDLPEMVKKGAFRQDLFYRLNVVSLRAPSLRQRPEDIVPLAEHFTRKFAAQCGRRIAGISPQARQYLVGYSWPGNVRELENAIERAVVLGSGDMLLAEDLPESIREERSPGVSATLYEEAVDAAKREVVMRAFEQAQYEHEEAARILGLHPNYLHRLIRNLDMRAAVKAAGRGR